MDNLYGYYVVEHVDSSSNAPFHLDFYTDWHALLKVHLCGLYFEEDVSNTFFSQMPEAMRERLDNLVSRFMDDLRYSGFCGFYAFMLNQDLEEFELWYTTSVLPMCYAGYECMEDVPEVLRYFVEKVTVADACCDEQCILSCSTDSPVAYLLACDTIASGSKKFLLSARQMDLIEHLLCTSDFSAYDDFASSVCLLAKQFSVDSQVLCDLIECYVVSKLNKLDVNFTSYGDFVRGALR